MITIKLDPIGNEHSKTRLARKRRSSPRLSRESSMLKTSPPKPPRNRVDISSNDLARLWCKHFGKSKSQIEAAISKVGDNAATVSKELQATSD
jgi:hypothetical protein